MVLVDSGAYIGSYSKNPYAFKDFGLNSLSFWVNDESVPGKSLALDTNSSVSAYDRLFDDENQDSDIERSDFNLGYALYRFRYHPSSTYQPPPPAGNVKLMGAFATGLTGNITLIIYSRFPSLMTIDHTRAITI